jgi:hypothetical protein
MTDITITRDIAAKVLETVDAGLSGGLGNPTPGEMCVEAAVCYALGLRHGDNPACVAPMLRKLKIELNDKGWSSPAVRAKGLRRLALAQLGSAGVLNEDEFLSQVTKMTVRVIVPRALRYAASVHPDQRHKTALESAAVGCETGAAAYAAYAAAARAVADAAAADARAAAARAAAEGAYAAARAAAAAASAADADARAADAAARAAASAGGGARAAAAASAADADAAYDAELAFFAEQIVQILIAMNAPGCAWLSLTEAA